ncbi:MAG: response regulator [Methylovulum sp.]|nr:response regulator [Methylovulum sp.]
MLTQPKPFEILLLEDEPADAYLVKLALKESKILARMSHVAGGIEGLDFLRRNGEYDNAPCPDLILLDINMPRMNGYEFLSAIKADKAFKTIPVVVLSTSNVERDIFISYDLGAAGYITKPIDITQLIAAITRLGDYWFDLVRLPQEKTA